MKIILSLFIVIILFFPTPAMALKATTVKDAVACFNKESLQEMQQFVVSKDRDSFNAYIRTGKCVILKEGLDVTVIDSPGMFGGTAMFIFQGIKLWTPRHGLKNYRAE